MTQRERQYECVVFGATGYTGKFTADNIASHLPTDFKWAVAGRNESKLKAVVNELRPLNPNRLQPGIEVTQNTKDELVQLAKKTKVLITTVGPYHKYGTAAFEACAETGTHYLDCTGEVPWVYDMIAKYSDIAKETGAIMIPQCGVESAPTDIGVWLLATHMRQTLSAGIGELIFTIHELNSAPSGGTLDTVLSLFESYSLSQVAKSMSPYSLSLVAKPPNVPRRPILEKLTGIRTDVDLGILTDSIQGPTDAPIVNRSWSLYDGGKFYGQRFQLTTYMKARSYLHAFIVHVAMTLGFAALILPPFRWLVKKFVYQPGEGTSKEDVKKERAEWRAIANADTSDPNDPKRAALRIRFTGGVYYLTGSCLAQAAITLARDQTFAHKLGGGVLTPATLGGPYLERLQKAGVVFEVKTLP